MPPVWRVVDFEDQTTTSDQVSDVVQLFFQESHGFRLRFPARGPTHYFWPLTSIYWQGGSLTEAVFPGIFRLIAGFAFGAIW